MLTEFDKKPVEDRHRGIRTTRPPALKVLMVISGWDEWSGAGLAEQGGGGGGAERRAGEPEQEAARRMVGEDSKLSQL